MGDHRSVRVPPGMTYPKLKRHLLASLLPDWTKEDRRKCVIVYKGLPRDRTGPIQMMRVLRRDEEPTGWLGLEWLISIGGRVEISLPPVGGSGDAVDSLARSEEHTSELQSTQ